MGVIGGIASIQVLALGFGVLRRGPVLSDERLEPAPLAPGPLETAATIPFAAEGWHYFGDGSVPVDGLATGGGNGAIVGGGAESSPLAPTDPLKPGPAAPLNRALRFTTGPKSPDVQAATTVLPPRPFGAPAAQGEAPALSAALAVAARGNALEGEPILERLLATGAELRASGNMQGALQAFREVESALPENPRILAELAATLSQMGLSDKANQYWERLEAAGPVVAGAYFPLAGQQLRGEAPPPADSGGKVMKIGEVKVVEEAPTSEGQKVSLRVVVDADPNARPVGDDLTLLVYFYDRVTGGEVKASTADTSYDYPSAPYDWQGDGTEEIVVKYNQPVLTEEQKLELGERSYYGYAIELYYRDQIQDKVVMPEEIARLRLESPAPAAPAGGFLGPENALFPESVYP